MNILAIFCLNALSENEESHEYIRNSGVNFTNNAQENKSQVMIEPEVPSSALV
jgi:hypothetical protein